MGEFEHTVDEKGRLAIPAKFRPKLADGLVITRGLDRCLFVYTTSEWGILAERIGRLPVTKPEARSFQRMIFSGATDCQLDQQGRVVVPVFLREYAGLTSDAIIIGVNNRLEIWSTDRWREVRDNVEQQGGVIAEQLVDFGI